MEKQEACMLTIGIYAKCNALSPEGLRHSAHTRNKHEYCTGAILIHFMERIRITRRHVLGLSTMTVYGRKHVYAISHKRRLPFSTIRGERKCIEEARERTRDPSTSTSPLEFLCKLGTSM